MFLLTSIPAPSVMADSVVAEQKQGEHPPQRRGTRSFLARPLYNATNVIPVSTCYALTRSSIFQITLNQDTMAMPWF